MTLTCSQIWEWVACRLRYSSKCRTGWSVLKSGETNKREWQFRKGEWRDENFQRQTLLHNLTIQSIYVCLSGCHVTLLVSQVSILLAKAGESEPRKEFSALKLQIPLLSGFWDGTILPREENTRGQIHQTFVQILKLLHSPWINMRENVRRDNNTYQVCVFDLPRLCSFHGQMILKTCKLSCTWTHNKTSLLIDFLSAYLTISLSCISKSGQPRLQWHLPLSSGSPSPASEKKAKQSTP